MWPERPIQLAQWIERQGDPTLRVQDHPLLGCPARPQATTILRFRTFTHLRSTVLRMVLDSAKWMIHITRSSGERTCTDSCDTVTEHHLKEGCQLVGQGASQTDFVNLNQWVHQSTPSMHSEAGCNLSFSEKRGSNLT